MEIAIKIKLSSGKEIELNEKEYEELKDSLSDGEKIVIQYVPYYPNSTPELPYWYSSSGSTTDHAVNMPHCTITNNSDNNDITYTLTTSTTSEDAVQMFIELAEEGVFSGL